MSLPRSGRGTVLGSEPGARKARLARLALLGQKIAAQPVDEPAESRLLRARRKRDGLKTVPYISAAEAPDVPRQHRERGAMKRSIVQELIKPSRYVRKEALQPVGGVVTRARRCQIARPILQIAAQDVRRDQPPIEQRVETLRAAAARQAAQTRARRHRRRERAPARFEACDRAPRP